MQKNLNRKIPKTIFKDISNDYGDKKYYIKSYNQQFLLRTFNVSEYIKHRNEEEYNYEQQYYYLKILRKKTKLVPKPIKLMFLEQENEYGILLQWIKGITLDKVINNFSKLTINKLARKTAKLLKVVNSLHKNKINDQIKEYYIFDRIRRIYLLQPAIKKNKDPKELILLKLLINKFKEYTKKHYFQKIRLVFSHGDFHFTNLVYYKNKIYAIDFNRCGFEFYLQDLVKLYFFDNDKNNLFVKKTIKNYFNPNNKNAWKIFKFLNIMFCLTSWRWAFLHRKNKQLYQDFLELIVNVVYDYDSFKLLIPKSLK